MPKYKIIDIHPADAHYHNRDYLIGQIRETDKIPLSAGHNLPKKWKFVCFKDYSVYGTFFFAVQLRKVRNT